VTTEKEALVGTTLDGRYRIVRELGRGGMGAVYEACHTGIDRRLAVKVLHAELASEPAVLERFRREARITGSLGHPNIIQITDTGTTPGGAPYLVMELLVGRSLSSVLRESVPLGIRQALAIISPVLRALSAVHANGIIHRDLKPENIFLTEGIGADGSGETVVKVLDFGIAKPVDTKFEGSTLTATGAIVGTPYYMSPEQVRGKDIDHRTDIYACGVILYQMLTGRPPFVADNFGDLVVAILNTAPIPMRMFRPELPEALEGIVIRAMARDKEDRYASAHELSRALETLASIPPVTVVEATAQAHVAHPGPAPSPFHGQRPLTPTSSPKWSGGDGETPLTVSPPSRVIKGPGGSGLKTLALAVGLVVVVAVAITVVLGVGAGTDDSGPASGSNVVPPPDPAPVVESSPAPVVVESSPAPVVVESSPAPVVPAAVERDSGVSEVVPSDSRRLPRALEVPDRPRREETPRRRIVTDIDDRRPPGPANAQGRVQPRRVVTDIDDRRPGGQR
jgi:serine/threonine-protein kinase